MRIKVSIKLIMIVAHMTSCAAPEEPAGLKSSKSSLASQTNVKASAMAVNYGGANIGDEDLKAAVKKCLDQGKFFDRSSSVTGACTSYKLAEVSCTDSTITTMMDARDTEDYKKIMSKDLPGYTLDQCLDCSSPVGNSFCEGNKAEKEKLPGTRLFHVKVTGTVVDIKTIYVYK